MDEGYIVLAPGAAPYIEMATNLAASLRVMDPRRGVCLVHDEGAELPAEARLLFTDFAPLPADPLYPPLMNKLRLYNLSPYARTMYVDADCLLVKRDVDLQWERASSRPFSITGDKATAGKHFEIVKKVVGSTQLAALEAQFEFWNGRKWWNIYKPMFIAYGFS